MSICFYSTMRTCFARKKLEFAQEIVFLSVKRFSIDSVLRCLLTFAPQSQTIDCMQ